LHEKDRICESLPPETRQMHEFKMRDAAAILGVSPDTVRRLADAGTLRTRRTRGGQRRVDGRSLATYLSRGDREGAGARGGEVSTRNHLPGIVTRVVRDRVAAQVEIQVGPHRMVSLLTREAADALRLEPGMPAIASVKATNVAIELPAPARRRRKA
jgi:molybdopterin-binding protein